MLNIKNYPLMLVALGAQTRTASSNMHVFQFFEFRLYKISIIKFIQGISKIYR